ncbi:hypothetical protein DRQ32_01320 [bacterium]|nr:MAG: hypothetical protein DRQ32_01320 [bacterium]
MAEKRSPELECVDPLVGERILELTRPGLAPDSQEQLEAHLHVCAFCVGVIDLERRLSSTLRKNQPRRVRRTRAPWLGGAAFAAAAGAAFCMFALPPRPIGPSVSIRGAGETRFVRPVEGEVVAPSGFVSEWTEVSGADAYELHLSEVDGPASWTASTTETRWRTGEDIQLAEGKTYQLVLSTLPADLVPPGSASVRFAAGGVSAQVTHRARQAQPIAYGLIVIASLLGIYAVREKWKA